MRVLYDFRELSPRAGKSPGIYRYALEVLANLSLNPDFRGRIVVACNRDNYKDLQSVAQESVKLLFAQKTYPGKIGRLFWLLLGANWCMRKNGCNIYYSPKGFLPWGLKGSKKKSVVTIHDMIPFYYADHFPGHFPWLEDKIVRHLLLRAARYATHVLTISRYSATQIRRYAGRNENISVAYNGIDSKKWVAGNHPKQDILLAMASELPHKNLQTILVAYSRFVQLNEKALPLYLLGLKSLDNWNSLLSDAARARIVLPGRVNDVELARLYASARAFIFVPHIEGFGFPALEAMLCGTSCIVSDIAVFRELFGRTCRFVNSCDSEELAQAMLEWQQLPPPALTREFSWQDHAGTLATLIKQSDCVTCDN